MEKYSPLVSILIPSYQVEEFILATVESAASQTYSKIEIIAVADGCTDGTVDILRDYGRHDSRLHIIALDKNEGVHLARVRAMSAAQGEFVGFLDADDWLQPEFVERMVSAMTLGHADIVICGIRYATKDGTQGVHKVRFGRSELVDKDILRRFCDLGFGTGSLCNKLYRREAIEPFLSQDFGETVPINEDYIVNFGAFATAKRVCLLSNTLYFYRQHPSSVTASSHRAKVFALMLRAYIVCLETYVGRISQAEELVDTLYAAQFHYDAYRVDSRIALTEYADHIAESLKRLAIIHPTAIYGLMHLFEKPARRPSLLWCILRSVVRRAKSLFSN
ncbi:MAG: glycosyltransferase family 2 protein [Candidatus Competibacteraceae bacterium]|nr:MAG: glycosyltransferase family 2 protein [Candidatus Competibacteraceae bacterium]